MHWPRLAPEPSPCISGFTGDDGGPCTACTVGKYKTSIGSGTCSHCLLHSTTLATETLNPKPNLLFLQEQIKGIIIIKFQCIAMYL